MLKYESHWEAVDSFPACDVDDHDEEECECRENVEHQNHNGDGRMVLLEHINN